MIKEHWHVEEEKEGEGDPGGQGIPGGKDYVEAERELTVETEGYDGLSRPTLDCPAKCNQYLLNAIPETVFHLCTKCGRKDHPAFRKLLSETRCCPS